MASVKKKKEKKCVLIIHYSLPTLKKMHSDRLFVSDCMENLMKFAAVLGVKIIFNW